MTRTANPLLFWAPAIMLSLLAHAALVMVIQLGTIADPVPMTEEIQTRIDVSSLDVPAQRAEAREAEGEVAESGEASGERLGVRDVPTSQARPVTPSGQTVAALAADAPVTRPAAARADALPATTAGGARLAAAVPVAPSLSSSTASATPVAPAAVPSTAAALSTPPRGEAVATVRPDTAAVTATASAGPVLAAATAVSPAIAAAAPSADTLAAAQSRGETAAAVLPQSMTMAAAEMPALALPRARPSGTELAPVSAAPSRLKTVTAGGVPVSPAAPPATAAMTLVAEATTLVASAGVAPAVAARPPPAVLMAAVATPSQTVLSGRAEGQQVASVQAPQAPVATLDAGSPGIAAPAALAAPQPTELAPSATSEFAGRVAPTSTAEAAVVATAALAWSGGAETVLDEQSLAAIQSFMQPGELSGSASFAGSVRDGIGAALAQFPCSRLQAAFQPESGGLEIRGHVPTEDMKGAVVGMLGNAVGDSIPVGGSVLVLPQPQCGVLDSVEGLGVPQSRDQIDDPLVIGEEAQARIEQYEDGSPMLMRLQAADFDSYIYIDYYDADGNVIHLLPNEYRGENRFAADTPFMIGEERSGFTIKAAPPFGQDIAVVLASTAPLYDGVRPLVERAVDYLPWLHARVQAFRDADPGFRGEWAYLFVITGPVGAFANR